MNITKNKIFKNHKKALLLVAAILCPLCFSSIAGTNSQTQLSVKAASEIQKVQMVKGLWIQINDVLSQAFLRLRHLNTKTVANLGAILADYSNYVRAILGVGKDTHFIDTNSDATKATAKLLGSNDGSTSDGELDYSKPVIPMIGSYVLSAIFSKLKDLVGDNDITAQVLRNANNLQILTNAANKVKQASAAVQDNSLFEYMKLVATAVSVYVPVLKAIKGDNVVNNVRTAIDDVINPFKTVIGKSGSSDEGGGASRLNSGVISMLNNVKSCIVDSRANDSTNLFTRLMLYSDVNNDPDNDSIDKVVKSLPNKVLTNTGLTSLQGARAGVRFTGDPNPHSVTLFKDLKDFILFGLFKVFGGSGTRETQVFPVLRVWDTSDGVHAPGAIICDIVGGGGAGDIYGNVDFMGSVIGDDSPHEYVSDPAQDNTRYYDGSYSNVTSFAFADLKTSSPVLRLFMTYLDLNIDSVKNDLASQKNLFDSYLTNIVDNADMNESINAGVNITGTLRIRNNASVDDVVGDAQLYPFLIAQRRRFVQSGNMHQRFLDYVKYAGAGSASMADDADYDGMLIGSGQTDSLKTVADTLRTDINTKSTELYNALRGGDGPISDQQLAQWDTQIQTEFTNSGLTAAQLKYWQLADTYEKALALANKYPNKYNNNNYFKLIDNTINSNRNLFNFDPAENWKIIGIAQGQRQAVRTLWDTLDQAKRTAFRRYGPDVFANTTDWPDVPGTPHDDEPQEYVMAHRAIQSVSSQGRLRPKKFWEIAYSKGNAALDFAKKLAEYHSEYDNVTFLHNVDALVTQYGMTADQADALVITDAGTITVAQFKQLNDDERMALRVRGKNVFTLQNFPEPSPQDRAQRLHAQFTALTSNDAKSRAYWGLAEAERDILRSHYQAVYQTDTANLYDNFLKPERDAGYIVRNVAQNNRWELVQVHRNTLKNLWDGWSNDKKEAAKLFAPNVFNAPPFTNMPPYVPDSYYTGKYANVAVSYSMFNQLPQQERQSILGDATYGLRFKGDPKYTNYDPAYALNDIDVYMAPIATLRSLTGAAAVELKKPHNVYGTILAYYLNKSDSQITSDFGNNGLKLREFAAHPDKYRAAVSEFSNRQLKLLYSLCLNFRFPPFVDARDVDVSNMSQSELERALELKSVLNYGNTVENLIKSKLDRLKRDNRRNYSSSSGFDSFDRDGWSTDSRTLSDNKKMPRAQSDIIKFFGSRNVNVSKRDLVNQDVVDAFVELLASGRVVNDLESKYYIKGLGSGVTPSERAQRLQMTYSALVMFGMFLITSNVDLGKARDSLRTVRDAMIKLREDNNGDNDDVLSDESSNVSELVDVFRKFIDDADVNNVREDLNKLRNDAFILGSKVVYGLLPKYLSKIFNGSFSGDEDASKVQAISKSLGEMRLGIKQFWKLVKKYFLNLKDSAEIMDNDDNNKVKYVHSKWRDVQGTVVNDIIDKVSGLHASVLNRAIFVVDSAIRGSDDSKVRRAAGSTSVSSSIQVNNIDSLITMLKNRHYALARMSQMIGWMSGDIASSGSVNFSGISESFSDYYSKMRQAFSSSADFCKEFGMEAEAAKSADEKGNRNNININLTKGTGSYVRALDSIAGSIQSFLNIFKSPAFNVIPVEGLQKINEHLETIGRLVINKEKLGFYFDDLVFNSDRNNTVDMRTLDMSNFLDTSAFDGFDGSSGLSVAKEFEAISEILEAVDKDRITKAAKSDVAKSVVPIKDAMMKIYREIAKGYIFYVVYNNSFVQWVFNLLNAPIDGSEGKYTLLKDLGYEWDYKKNSIVNVAYNLSTFTDKASDRGYSSALSNVFHLRFEDLKNNKSVSYLKDVSSIYDKAFNLEERLEKQQKEHEEEETAKAQLADKKRLEEEAKEKKEEQKKADKKAKAAEKMERKRKKKEEEELVEEAKQKQADVAAQQPQVVQTPAPVLPQQPESPISNYIVRGFDTHSAKMCVTADIQFNSQTREVAVDVQGLATDGDVFMDFFPNGGGVDKDQKRMATKTGAHSAKGTYILANDNVKSLEVQIYGRNGSADGLGEDPNNFQGRVIIPLNVLKPNAGNVHLQAPVIKDGASNPMGIAFIDEVIKTPDGAFLFVLNEQLLMSVLAKTVTDPEMLKTPFNIADVFCVIVPDNGSEKAKSVVAVDPKTGKKTAFINPANANAMGVVSKPFQIHLYYNTQKNNTFIAKFDIDPNAILQQVQVQPGQQVQAQPGQQVQAQPGQQVQAQPGQQVQAQPGQQVQAQPGQQVQAVEKPVKEVEEVLTEKVSKPKSAKKVQDEEEDDDVTAKVDDEVADDKGVGKYALLDSEDEETDAEDDNEPVVDEEEQQQKEEQEQEQESELDRLLRKSGTAGEVGSGS